MAWVVGQMMLLYHYMLLHALCLLLMGIMGTLDMMQEIIPQNLWSIIIPWHAVG